MKFNFDKDYYNGRGVTKKSNYSDYTNAEKVSNYFFSIMTKNDFFNDVSRILDVGCAFGYMINKCANTYNCPTTGVDVSQYAIQKAKKNFLKTNFLVSDLNSNISLEAESFSNIIMLDVIEHLDSPHNTLIDLRKLLKDGGKIIIRTPNIMSIERFLRGKKFHGYKDDSHIYLFCFQTLKHLLEKSGFKVISYGSDSYPFPFMKNITIGGSIWIIAEKNI